MKGSQDEPGVDDCASTFVFGAGFCNKNIDELHVFIDDSKKKLLVSNTKCRLGPRKINYFIKR